MKPALRIALGAAFLCAACDVVPGQAPTTWVISEIDGKAFPARATLSFQDSGEIAGMAPCNQYRAAMAARTPRFDPGPITVTRQACPKGALEVEYLFRLSQMTTSEFSGGTLTLSEPGGSTMVFKSAG